MNGIGATANGGAPRGNFTRWVPLLIAPVCILLQFPGRLLPALAALAIWLTCLAFCDRTGLRRMARPRFWIISLLLAAACGMLLGRRDSRFLGIMVSRAGITSGLLMVVRGAFIFGLSIWASRALSGTTRARLGKRPGNLSDAVCTAFRLLPELGERLRREWREAKPQGGRLRRIASLAADILLHTAKIAEQGAARSKSTAGAVRLVAVLGQPDSGKTTTIAELARRLRERGLSVAGVSQPKVITGGARGYSLRDEAGGEQRPFATPRQTAVGNELCGFRFDPAGWAWARGLIESAGAGAGVVIVDELGRLEAAGRGHMPALLDALPGKGGTWILGVRKEFEGDIRRQIGPFVRTIDAGATCRDLDALVDWLVDR